MREINGKNRRNFLEVLLTGEKIGLTKITEMCKGKLIATNLKETDEQLVDDLNGVLSALQKKVMRTMLTHIDELAKGILACPSFRRLSKTCGMRRYMQTASPNVWAF